MRKRECVKAFIAMITFLGILQTVFMPASAEDTVKVMQVLSDDRNVKVYVRGGQPEGEIKYQIGNVPVDTPDVYSVQEDSQPMRTLIMLDNSLSIPKDSRDKVLEMMRMIITGHGEKEQFRLATFDEEIRYLTDGFSADYTALINIVNSIGYENMHTAATNVLYRLIDALEEEAYMGYTRIVIITDGVDDQPLGEMNRDELSKKLEESGIPVYAVGTNTGKNSDQLSNLFALSRLTGCEYWILEDTGAEDIAASLALDYGMLVCQAVIPEQVKTGGKQSSKLTMGDGTVLSFEVKMPFGISVQEEPESTVPDVKAEREQKATVEQESTESVEESTQQRAGIPFWVLIIAGLIVVIILGMIVAILVLVWQKRKSTGKSAMAGLDGAGGRAVPVSENTVTAMLDDEEEKKTGNTVQLTPVRTKQKEYRLVLTDQSNPARTFQSVLVHEVRIGHKPENQIVISDDNTVSGIHCRILCKEGSFFVEDMGSKNKTFVNGSKEPVALEQLIVSGSTVKIGRAVYLVSIKES